MVKIEECIKCLLAAVRISFKNTYTRRGNFLYFSTAHFRSPYEEFTHFAA